MYDSPIRLAVSKMTSQFNDGIYNAVVKTGIDVDKDELVRALNYDRNQYEKGYRDGLKASKWISVKERLPERHCEVLAYYGFEREGSDDLGYMCMGVLAYYAYDRIPHFQHESSGVRVTHWMPLPEPPKEEGENT
jgi:hypothetical protein